MISSITVVQQMGWPVHRAWLETPPSSSHGFDLVWELDDTTHLSIAESTEASPRGGLVGVAYTLDGRKHNGKPTAKGIYIFNGRKVVIK